MGNSYIKAQTEDDELKQLILKYLQNSKSIEK